MKFGCEHQAAITCLRWLFCLLGWEGAVIFEMSSYEPVFKKSPFDTDEDTFINVFT